MPFYHYLQFQIRYYLLRKRWLLPFPILIFMAYRSYNALGFQSVGVLGGVTANAWDILFLALGNPYNVYFAITLMYIYLVCDLVPEPPLGQLMLLRLNSRRSWWLVKTTTLLVLTLTYMVGTIVLLAIFASLVLPWETGYSEMAAAFPDQVNLPMNFFRVIQPPTPIMMLARELLLLLLGLLSIGLLMMVTTQLTQRYFLGLAAGCFFLFGSYYGLHISGPPSWTLILPSVHLTYTTFTLIRSLRLVYSILYWAVWIAALGTLGYWLSLRQDHLANWELD